MRKALAQVIPPAEPQSRDAPEKHLHPAHYRHRFPHDAVGEHHVSPYASVDALFEVQLEVDSECYLGDQHEHDGRGEGGVDVGCELAAAVSVTEEVSDDGE